MFTLNNYTEDQEQVLAALVSGNMNYQYLVYGKETGESGTPHLQGWFFLKKKKVGRMVLKELPSGIAIMTTNHIQKSIDYCKKDGKWFEWGTQPNQGQRTDLEEMRQLIVEGADMETISDKHFGNYLRYAHNIKEYRQMKRKKLRNWFPKIYIFWGITGMGKTRKVFDSHEYKDVWKWNNNHQFYQQYDMHSIVLFDDFYGNINLEWMLQLCDRYPCTINVKGGDCNWQPTHIYFTSNIDPMFWKGWEEEPPVKRDAFYRRISDSGGEIREFTEKEWERVEE